MPSIYVNNENEAKTLCIILKDIVMNASIYLYYTIFADYDVICRHTEIVNHGDKSIYLDKVMSFSMDFADSDYDVMTLSGAHLYEKIFIAEL